MTLSLKDGFYDAYQYKFASTLGFLGFCFGGGGRKESGIMNKGSVE